MHVSAASDVKRDFHEGDSFDTRRMMEKRNESLLALGHSFAEAGDADILSMLDIREKLVASDHCRMNIVLYAYVNDYLIAALDFTLRPEGLYIDLVFVKPEFRRRGIGLALAKHLLERYPQEKVQWDEMKSAEMFPHEACKR